MPFPNYHSARLIEPKKFKKYAYKKVGKGIDMVFGIDEELEQELDEKTHLQAIRFDKNKWSVADAKAWLKKHGKKYISFTPASIKEDAGPASEPSGPGNIVPTVTTHSSDIAQYVKRVGPMVSRQGDKKKKTLKETLEYIVNGTQIN